LSFRRCYGDYFLMIFAVFWSVALKIMYIQLLLYLYHMLLISYCMNIYSVWIFDILHSFVEWFLLIYCDFRVFFISGLWLLSWRISKKFTNLTTADLCRQHRDWSSLMFTVCYDWATLAIELAVDIMAMVINKVCWKLGRYIWKLMWNIFTANIFYTKLFACHGNVVWKSCS